MGRSTPQGKRREEPEGARLRDPGVEGGPGAAGLKAVGPDVCPRYGR